MAGRSREIREAVMKVLREEEDIQGTLEFGHSGSHQHVLFMLCGRQHRFVFGSTPSDKMSLLATRTKLRKSCRAIRQAVKA